MAFGSFDNNNRGHTMSEINMVPLIDVMLVLLVIFIITAPLLSHSIKINLPQVTAEPAEKEPVVVDLAVNDLGQLFWNEQPVMLDDLAMRLKQEARQDPQPQLRIRADLNTRYEILAEIMGSARAAGLKRVGFVTRPSENTSTPFVTPSAASGSAPAASSSHPPASSPTGQATAQNTLAP